MPNEKYNLICIAHPDDETIFFGGLLLSSRAKARRTWKIVCATNANADGQGARRKKQFEKACRALGVSHFEWLGFPDIYEKRIPIDELSFRLHSIQENFGEPREIYTHGIVGEYGHPHHQDVSFAVHSTFKKHPKLYSVAYNSYPEKRVLLTESEFKEKTRILTKIYGSETNRFLNLLPATSVEGYSRVEFSEVSALYSFFADGRPLNLRALHHYKWLAGYLKQNRHNARPF